MSHDNGFQEESEQIEQPKESAEKKLEEAAQQFANDISKCGVDYIIAMEIFESGARWQQQQTSEREILIRFSEYIDKENYSFDIALLDEKFIDDYLKEKESK